MTCQKPECTDNAIFGVWQDDGYMKLCGPHFTDSHKRLPVSNKCSICGGFGVIGRHRTGEKIVKCCAKCHEAQERERRG